MEIGNTKNKFEHTTKTPANNSQSLDNLQMRQTEMVAKKLARSTKLPKTKKNIAELSQNIDEQSSQNIHMLSFAPLQNKFVLNVIKKKQETELDFKELMIQVAPMLLLVSGLWVFGERFSRAQWIGFGTFFTALATVFETTGTAFSGF